jgi:3D (Asp-Asp-Asp) domain-containing protein
MVDYGDRVEFWKAQDCGIGVNGNHIDLAVETHAEAMEKGVEMATVYFMEVFNEFG